MARKSVRWLLEQLHMAGFNVCVLNLLFAHCNNGAITEQYNGYIVYRLAIAESEFGVTENGESAHGCHLHIPST